VVVYKNEGNQIPQKIGGDFESPRTSQVPSEYGFGVAKEADDNILIHQEDHANNGYNYELAEQ
jgi:hypothetical protein